MPSFNRQTPMVRFPPDLRSAIQKIADSEHKSFAGLAKGAILLIHRDRLSKELGKDRYDELVAEYVRERDDDAH